MNRSRESRMEKGNSDRQPGTRGIVVPPSGGREIRLGVAGVVTIKVGRPESSGTLTAYEFTMPPGTAGPPLHIHRSWDELFHVIEGEMTFLIDGVTSLAPAGSLVFIPRGIEHTFWNASKIPARQLTVFAPSGIEDYFDEVSDSLARGGAESLDAAVATMVRHDMIVPPNSRPAYGALDY